MLKIGDLVKRESLLVAQGNRTPLSLSPAYEAVGLGLAVAKLCAGKWEILHLQSGSWLALYTTRARALTGLNVLIDSGLDWTVGADTMYKPTLLPSYTDAVKKAREWATP